MAQHQAAVFAPQMHTVAFAVVKGFAVLARLEFAHPAAVAVGFESVLPHIPERVFVDVALVVLPAYARAGGYAAVDQYRCYAQSGGALVQMVAHLALVAAQVPLAGVRYMASGCPLGCDEIHQLPELLVRQDQFGVLRRTPHRIDAEHAPVAHAEAPQ